MTSPSLRLSLGVLAAVLGLSGSARADFGGLCGPNQVMAGPASGPAAAAQCRTLTVSDTASIPFLFIGPNLNQMISLSGSVAGGSFPNNLQINPDTIAVPGLAFMTGWTFSDYFAGGTATGARQVIEAFFNQTAIAPSNTFSDYVAGTFLAQTSTGDGGTNLTTSPKGSYFGLNPYFNLLPGAINVGLATAGEANSIAQTGSSLKIKALWSLVGGGTLDQVQGSTLDTMLAISNQAGGVLHKSAISIGATFGAWPIDPTGDIMTTDGNGTAVNGINISNTSFSGCSFFAKNFSSCLNFLNASLNAGGIYPLSGTTSFSFGDNFSNGSREINLFNDDQAATVTLVVYQKTGASAVTPVFQANTTNIAVPGIAVTAMPTEAHAAGHACVGYDNSTNVLYISSTVTTC